MNPRKISLVVLAFCLWIPAPAQDVFDAARNGDLKRLEELTKLKPDTVNSRSSHGFTPLIIAGYRNQIKAVEFLLDHKADINASSPEGPVVLGACYKGNLELTEILIQHNADVNTQNEQGTSALMYAALSNNIDLVKLLLKDGAKKDLTEKSGKTALDYAKINGSKEIIDLLSK
jgi:ankyrin repeat protein